MEKAIPKTLLWRLPGELRAGEEVWPLLTAHWRGLMNNLHAEAWRRAAMADTHLHEVFS